MKHIFKTLSDSSKGHQVYIVGGWLRDIFLKRVNKDLDLAVSGNARALALKISKALRGRLVVLDEKNRIYRIVLKDSKVLEYIDISALKGPTIEQDLSKRDFTINSFACPLTKNGYSLKDIIDPFRGIRDLKKGLVRATGNRAFAEDPLRMLRAFRFAAELGFSIEPATLRAVKKHHRLISKSAGERIKEEIYRILLSPVSASYVKLIDRHGLLEVILPEIIPMKKSARNFYFHPQGLWQHSTETLACLEEIISDLKELFHSDRARISAYLGETLSAGSTRLQVLKLTALLHDLAKPKCAKKIDGKMRFLGHDTKGAEMIGRVFERMKLSRKEIRAAKNIVGHHMRPISLGQANVLTSRASVRLFRAAGDELPMLLLLSLADCYSYRGLKVKKSVELKKMKQVVRDLFAKYFSEKDKASRPKLIDGHVLMKKLDLEPGPVIGKLLNAVAEAQLMGKVNTQEEALSLARKTLTRIKK